MSSYRRLRVFAILALATVLLGGFGGTLTPRREIFPFASWFLFSLVPFRTDEYDILVHPAEDGAPPLPFNRAGDMVHSSHSIVSYQLIQQLGRAEELHNRDLIDRLRQQIEPRFRAPRTHYDLVKISYAPVPRWRTGQVLSQSAPVAVFVAGEPTP